MKEKEISDEDLELELDQAYKLSEKKKTVFLIMRKEKESLDIREMILNSDNHSFKPCQMK